MLTNLLWIMTEEHYQRFLKEFSSNKELKDFLVNVFVVFTEIVKHGIFLKDWIVIIVLGNRYSREINHNYIFYHSLQIFLPFHGPRVHHVT